MKSQKVIALLLSTALSVSTCMPLGNITALGAETEPAAQAVEVQEEDSDSAENEESPQKEDSSEAEATENISEDDSEEPAEEAASETVDDEESSDELLPGQKRSGRAPGIPVLTQLPVPIQVPIPKSLRARTPVHGLIPTISRTLLKLRQEKTRLRISRVETALFSFVSPRMRHANIDFTPILTSTPTPNFMIPVCRSYTQVIMTTVRILKSTILLTKERHIISKSVHGTPISLLSKCISGRYISPVNL